MKPLKKELLNNLKVDQVIDVQIAHVFTNGEPSCYSTQSYKIESISKKVIIGRSTVFKQEMIDITRKHIDDGYFKINI